MITSRLIDGSMWTAIGVSFVFFGIKRLRLSKKSEKEGKPKDSYAPWLVIIGSLLTIHGIYNLIRAFL